MLLYVCMSVSLGVVWFKEKKEIGKFCTFWYGIRANITIVLCILTSIRLYYKDSKTHLKPFYHSTKPIYNNTILFSLLMYKRHIPFCPLHVEMKLCVISKSGIIEMHKYKVFYEYNNVIAPIKNFALIA